jgi:hypothetical protein
MDTTSLLAMFAGSGVWVGWYGILAVLLVATIMRRRSRKEKEQAKSGAGGRYAA